MPATAAPVSWSVTLPVSVARGVPERLGPNLAVRVDRDAVPRDPAVVTVGVPAGTGRGRAGQAAAVEPTAQRQFPMFLNGCNLRVFVQNAFRNDHGPSVRCIARTALTWRKSSFSASIPRCAVE